MSLSPLKDVSPGMIFNDRSNLSQEDLQNIQELGKRDSYAKDVGMLQTQREASAAGSNEYLFKTGSSYGVIADSLFDDVLACTRLTSSTIRVSAGSAIDGRGRIITLASNYDLSVTNNKYVCLKFVPLDSESVQHPITGTAQNHKRDGYTTGANIIYLSDTHPKDSADDDRKDDVVLDFIRTDADLGGVSPLRYQIMQGTIASGTYYDLFFKTRMVRSSKHIFKDVYGNLEGANIDPTVLPGSNLDRFLACKGSAPRSTSNPFGVAAADAAFTPISDLPYSEDIGSTTIQDAITELNNKVVRRATNLLLNPTAALGNRYWYGGWDGLGSPMWSVVEGSYGEGFYFGRASSPAADEVQISRFTPAMENTNYNISAEIYNEGMTSGQFKIVLRFYDSSYNALAGDVELLAINGANWKVYSKYGLSPTNTRYMRVALVIVAGSVTTNTAVRRINLQAANYGYTDRKSIYVDDSSIRALKDHTEQAVLDHPDGSVIETKLAGLSVSEPKVKRTVYDAATPPNIITEGNSRTNEWLPIMLNDGTSARLDTNTPLSSFPKGKSWVVITPDYPTAGASLVQASSFGLPLNYGVIETFRHENYAGAGLDAAGSHQKFIPWASDPVVDYIPQKIRYWKNDNSGWGVWGSFEPEVDNVTIEYNTQRKLAIKDAASYIDLINYYNRVQEIPLSFNELAVAVTPGVGAAGIETNKTGLYVDVPNGNVASAIITKPMQEYGSVFTFAYDLICEFCFVARRAGGNGKVYGVGMFADYDNFIEFVIRGTTAYGVCRRDGTQAEVPLFNIDIHTHCGGRIIFHLKWVSGIPSVTFYWQGGGYVDVNQAQATITDQNSIPRKNAVPNMAKIMIFRAETTDPQIYGAHITLCSFRYVNKFGLNSIQS